MVYFNSAHCGCAIIAIFIIAFAVPLEATFNEEDGISLVYDYVIIGLGGSGSMFANRLSGNSKNNVLAIERGENPTCEQCDNTILGSISELNDARDPTLFSTPQLAFGRKIRQVRFEGAGGSTRIYGGLSIPSSPEVFNTYYPPEYSYQNILPYLKKVQNHYCNYLPFTETGITPQECAQYHGSSGPMDISPTAYKSLSNVSKEVVEGFVEMGIPHTNDYMNPSKRQGIHPLQFFRRMQNATDSNSKRTRESTWTGYLPESVRNRANLDIIFGAQAYNLIYFGKKVIGVAYTKEGSRRIAIATKQVILSGGPFHSSKFLQLNGIGPSDLLTQYGIPVVYNNTHVGNHLQSHMGVTMAFQTKKPVTVDPERNTYNSFTTLLRSPYAPLASNDVQIDVLDGVSVGSFNTPINGPTLEYVTTPPTNGAYPFISFLVSIVDTDFRGSVKIQSKNIHDKPLIDHGWTATNFYPGSREANTIDWAFSTLRNLTTNTQWGKNNVVREIHPGANLGGNDFLWYLYQADAIYHDTSANPMGLVTDYKGQVKGVEGLTMCDNSILPKVPNANPTLTMLAVCEKVADYVLGNI